MISSMEAAIEVGQATETIEPIPEIKPEPTDDNASRSDESELNPTPWEFLTTPPDKETILKPRTESPDALFLGKVKVDPEDPSPSLDDDKTLIDPESKTFIEALDHLTGQKFEQDTYFIEQNGYGDQLLFAENALLDVASEETVTPDGSEIIRNLLSLCIFSSFLWTSVKLFRIPCFTSCTLVFTCG